MHLCTLNSNALLLFLEHFKTFPEKETITKISRPLYEYELRSATLKNKTIITTYVIDATYFVNFWKKLFTLNKKIKCMQEVTFENAPPTLHCPQISP